AVFNHLMLRKIHFLLALACVCAFLGRAQGGTPTHAQLIREGDDQSLQRGKQLYDFLYITCHGAPAQAGTLPASRPFWKEPFKNGSDPFSIYRTLTDGLGQMPAWTFLTAEQRYDAIHYIREAFVRPLNPAAYFKLDEAYLAGLPREPLVAKEIA